MSEDAVKVEGTEAVTKFFDQLQGKAKALAVAWLKLFEGKLKPYPPPRGGPPAAHYERGYGPVWPVKNDAVRPESASRGVELRRAGWHGRHSSERLGSSWALDETKTDRAILGNTASYAPYVQHQGTGGLGGGEKVAQATVHMGRWKTDQAAYDETLPQFQRMCVDVCMEAARKAGAVNVSGGAE